MKVLTHGVPEYKHLPILEIQKYNGFPTLALQINEGTIKISNSRKIKDYSKKEGDVIIEPDKHENGIINVSAQIRKKSMEVNCTNSDNFYSHTCEIINDVVLDLFVIFNKNK